MYKLRLKIFWLLFLLNSYFAYAQEGTKQFSPDLNNNGTLDVATEGLCYIDISQIAFANESSRVDQRLNVYMKAGEKLFIGMNNNSSSNATNTSFRIKAPSGTVQVLKKSSDNTNAATVSSRYPFPKDNTSGLNNDDGYIDNFDQVNKGANGTIVSGTTITNGYTPLYMVASETGDYYIEFEGWSSSSFTSVSSISSNYIRFFGVTITDASNNILNDASSSTTTVGRLWSKSWKLSSTSFTQYIKSRFYVYTNDGFVNRLDPNIAPFDFIFLSNSFGTDKTTDAFANRKSFRGNAFASKDLSEHKIFLNDPDLSVYPNSTIKPIVKIYFNNVLIFDFDYSRTPQQASLSPGTISVLRNGLSGCPHESMALLRIESNIIGQAQFLLDIDGSGFSTSSTADRSLFVDVRPGTSYLPWDIKEGNGAVHRNGGSFDANVIFLLAGITHFPLYDVENCDALTTQAVRPYNRLGPILYWDDSNIPLNGGSLTVWPGPTPVASVITQINNPPVTSTRKWVYNNNNTDPNNGNINTLNSWFAGLELVQSYQYSVSSPNICINNDHDRDKKFDVQDVDDDNDGIPDVIEAGGTRHPNVDANANSVLDWIEDNNVTDPSFDEDADGVWNYKDSNDPNIKRAWVDSNSDGVNDNYDKDKDGVPDIFDLDSDQDGIKDVSEQGGTDGDNNGIVGSNGVSVTGANGSTLPTFTVSPDLDVDLDGLIDRVDPIVFGGTAGTPLGIYNSGTGSNTFTTASGDNDGDGVSDYQDIDADNDGIIDWIEAQATAAPSSGILPAQPLVIRGGTDSDLDGLNDAYDTYYNQYNETAPFGTFGNTILGLNLTGFNNDGTDTPDYKDLDSDNDGQPDWYEGFDNNQNAYAIDDLISIALNYESNAGNPGHYSNSDSNNNGVPNWLEPFPLSTVSTLANFMNKSNAAFRDTDNDGLVNLFDSDNNGTGYGSSASIGQPNNDADAAPNFRDTDGPVSLRCTGPVLTLSVSSDVSTLCTGGTVVVSIANSEVGTTYQLRNDLDNSNLGSAVAGTGATITISLNLTASTTINVYATKGLCSDVLNNKLSIIVYTAPSTSLTVSAQTSSICSSSGTNILVQNSETGVSYQLRNNANNSIVGTAVAGTGSTISLPTGTLTTNTTFNVLATRSGCTSVQLNTVVSVTVTILSSNTFSVQGATVCGIGIANLVASGAPSGSTYNWYTAATGGTPITTGSTYSPSVSSAVTYYVSFVSSGCESNRLPATVTYFATSLSVSIIATDKVVQYGSSTTLRATGAETYTWLPRDGSITDQSASGDVITIKPDAKTVYRVTGRNAQGCSQTDSVTIDVQFDIFIPSLFSPNGDGSNDKFIVHAKGISNIDLRVFDRAGNLLYRTTDVTQATEIGWDGKSNGQDQPIGMYVWAIEGKFANGNSIKYKNKDTGEINITR